MCDTFYKTLRGIGGGFTPGATTRLGGTRAEISSDNRAVRQIGWHAFTSGDSGMRIGGPRCGFSR